MQEKIENQKNKITFKEAAIGVTAAVAGVSALFAVDEYVVLPMVADWETRDKADEIADLQQGIEEGKGQELADKAFSVTYGTSTLVSFSQNKNLSDKLVAVKASTYADQHPYKHAANEMTRFGTDFVAGSAVFLGVAMLANKIFRR